MHISCVMCTLVTLDRFLAVCTISWCLLLLCLSRKMSSSWTCFCPSFILHKTTLSSKRSFDNTSQIFLGYGNYVSGRFASVIGGTANTGFLIFKRSIFYVFAFCACKLICTYLSAKGRWSLAAGKKAQAIKDNSASLNFNPDKSCKTSLEGEFKICAKK